MRGSSRYSNTTSHQESSLGTDLCDFCVYVPPSVAVGPIEEYAIPSRSALKQRVRSSLIKQAKRISVYRTSQETTSENLTVSLRRQVNSQGSRLRLMSVRLSDLVYLG